jgi:transcription initiation factor TFIIB
MFHREFGTCDCGEPDPVFDSHRSEDVCQNCGVVLEPVLHDGPEWGYDDEGRDASHVGMPNSRLGTVMGPVDGVSKRVAASSVDRADAAERHLKTIVEDVCKAMRIASKTISARSAEMFEKYVRLRFPSGESRRAAAAACVYYACRNERLDRELRAFSIACQIDVKTLNAAVKSVNDELKCGTFDVSTRGFDTLVVAYLERLPLSPAEYRAVWRETLASLSVEDFDSGKKPRTIVGGALYASIRKLGIEVSKQDVMAAAGVCAQTLDKACGI